MTKIINLIKSFLTEELNADEFAFRYIELWNEIREEQERAIDGQPGLRDAFVALGKKLHSGVITVENYKSEWRQLADKAKGCSVAIGSREDEILSSLFVTVDAYEGDPELKMPYNIDEDELRQNVKEIYNELSKLQSR